MRIEKGILLIATGHPYYGRLAYNLCASIKAVENIPVAVVYSGRSLCHLAESQMSLFDEKIELPPSVPDGFAPKLYMNELTPFRETLFLDADMLWLPYRKPSDLFAELSAADYTGITEGYIDIATMDSSAINNGYHFWADPQEIIAKYKLKEGTLYQWRSELVYFKSGKVSDKIFKKAQAIHADPKLASAMKFGSHYPDELSINISTALAGIHPHKKNWTPAYWHKLYNSQPPRNIQDWYLVSFGGNTINSTIKKMYDNIAQSALRKIGRQHVFGLFSKKQFLPERNKM